MLLECFFETNTARALYFLLFCAMYRSRPRRAAYHSAARRQRALGRNGPRTVVAEDPEPPVRTLKLAQHLGLELQEPEPEEEMEHGEHEHGPRHVPLEDMCGCPQCLEAYHTKEDDEDVCGCPQCLADSLATRLVLTVGTSARASASTTSMTQSPAVASLHFRHLTRVWTVAPMYIVLPVDVTPPMWGECHHLVGRMSL